MEGACISGPDKFQVEANSTASYPLTFEPTLSGKTTAQLVLFYMCNYVHTCMCYTHRVIFDGGPDGEFWYQLELVADDPTPVTLSDLNCDLGK